MPLTRSQSRCSVSQINRKLQGFDWSCVEAKPGKNKGGRGQLLERALGIPNSSALRDLCDGELKTFTIGQSTACTQLKHCLSDIVRETPFSSSIFGTKIETVIYVAFSKEGHFLTSTTLNSCRQIREDYEFICEKVRTAIRNRGELNTITGPNQTLQIRTKSTKNSQGEYAPLMYEGHRLKDKGMAFYLCADYGRRICAGTV